MKNIYRHGDISLHETTDIEKGEIIKHKGSFVLAEGETTGHKHLITVPDIADMVVTKLADGSAILSLKSDGLLTHEEHKTIKVKKGVYKIQNEREFDYFQKATRKVLD